VSTHSIPLAIFNIERDIAVRRGLLGQQEIARHAPPERRHDR
jgi:hypothetical protein